MAYAQSMPQGRGPAPRGAANGPARPKRPLWQWIVVAGVALLGLLIVLIVAAIVLWQILMRGNPQDTLDDYYSSLSQGDCDLFQESTTRDFRDATGLSDCSIFEAATSGVTDIDYEVTDRVNRSGYAIFYVTEAYSDDGVRVEVPLRYYVERTDGQWDLAGIELVDPTQPDPITGR
ncbi:hypothetical protein ACXET9_14250 [Brachybacterium sp. DNPG3]